jgi:hypothetical protein
MANQPKISDIKKNDYVVASVDGKPGLIRVLSLNDDTIKGKHEVRDQEYDVEIPLDLVKANLGPKPEIGSVYGCKTERLLDVFNDVGPFGLVEWYFEANEEEQKQVHDNLVHGAKLLKRHGLHHILRVCKARVVLNTAKKLTGKAVIGTYACKGASEENPDILTVKHHADSVKLGPRLVCHEAGHGIWHRLMPAKMRAEWISMFVTRTSVEHIDAGAVGAALKLAVSERTLVLSDEDLQPTLDLIVSRVCEASSLRWIDIETLLNHNVAAAKTVLQHWRYHSVAYSEETNTLVTDYAGTNPEEFWCEALANHCTGVATPDYLDELLTRTLAYLNGKRVSLGEDE